MTRRTYKSVLAAKGLKPIRGRAHTPKAHGDLELMPVAGCHRHVVESDNVVELIRRDQRAAVIL